MLNCFEKNSNTFPFYTLFNTWGMGKNGRHFADNIFKCIFFNENIWTLIKISLKFVPKGPINNIPALVQIMAWCRPGDKPLSEPMMVRLPMHICVTRPQWLKRDGAGSWYPASWMTRSNYLTKSLTNGCWCPGNARRQGISSHGIDLVFPNIK